MVQTHDHGPVTIPEPAWCNRFHPDGDYRQDISHESVHQCVLVDTTCHGPIITLEANFSKYPLSSRAQVHVNVEIDGHAHEFDPDGLRALADSLVSHAGALRAMADQLPELKRDDC
jgi:hypothetical protein